MGRGRRPGDDDDDDDDGEDDGSEGSESEEEEKRMRVVYRLAKGKLVRLERGMEQYEEIAARSASKLGKKT
jgi:TATA-binding protein-associated factor Taf7